jgi:hypothetical protein
MTVVVGSDRAAVKPRLVVLAWAVAAVSVAGFIAAWVLAVRNRNLLSLSANFGPDRFLVAYAVVGGVVASRRSSNPIGWFLLGIGLVTACRGLAGEYALYALAGSARPASGVWAAWFVNWSLILLFPGGLVTFLLLSFPNGRPVTPRWWAVGWAGVGMGAFILLADWFHPGPVAVYGLPSVPNPTGIHGFFSLTWGSWLFGAAYLLSWGCLLTAASSVFVRYRRSAGEERLQVKWFAYAAVLSLALLVALLPLSFATATGQLLSSVVIVVGLGLALPLTVGIAILKYRLYAIDKIISRTVSYALVTGLVAGVYLGCVALLTKILPFRGSVGIAVAVLAAAALFNPLRRRVQAMVDRRFDRARYDAERVVAQFSVQLREQVDLDVLGNDLLGVVNHVLAPAHVTLWLSQEVPPVGNAEQDTLSTPEIPALPRSLAVPAEPGATSARIAPEVPECYRARDRLRCRRSRARWLSVVFALNAASMAWSARDPRPGSRPIWRAKVAPS